MRVTRAYSAPPRFALRALVWRWRDKAAERRAAEQTEVGLALLSVGESDGDAKCLRDSVSAFNLALAQIRPARIPRLWAQTQTHLATALTRLAERDGETTGLVAACAALRGALALVSCADAPFDWAMRQSALATVLVRVGGADGDQRPAGGGDHDLTGEHWKR